MMKYLHFRVLVLIQLQQLLLLLSDCLTLWWTEMLKGYWPGILELVHRLDQLR